MIKNSVPEFSKAIFHLEQHERQNGFPEWVVRHQKEVFFLAYRMGEKLGLKNEQLTNLSIAARFHDIGKTHIDPQIINYKGRLTEEQKFEVFKHVHQSYDILKKKGINSKAILEGVFYHHENFDGTGYPDKLKADEISFEAQILRIVDSYSAMLGARPYQNSNNNDYKRAEEQIKNGKGVLYNPRMVDAFLKIIGHSEIDKTTNSIDVNLYNLLFQ